MSITFLDLQNKINALYGYTPSQSALLSDTQLLEIAIEAIGANVSSLSEIATAYNNLMGSNFSASELPSRPDILLRGIKLLSASRGNSGNSNNIVPLIIFTGESNSGGIALNSDLTSGQLSPRPAVQILNNLTFEFEDLDIGTNNLLDHAQLEAYSTTSHSWENGLASSVEAGDWGYSQVYLVKAGQGGSKIADWGTGGTYFTKLVERVNAAKALIKAQGKIPLPFIWYSQGINDRTGGTNGSAWKSATLTHFQNLRQQIGYAPILEPSFMSGNDPYNTYLGELASSDKFFFVVDSTGAGVQGDGIHWTASGQALIASRLADRCINSIGVTFEEYSLSANNALSGLVATGGDTPTLSPVNWVDLVNAFNGSPAVGYVSSTTNNSGGKSDRSIDATQPFSFVFDLEDATNSTAIVVCLHETSGASYGWDSSNTYPSGFYAFNGNLYRSFQGNTGTLAAAVPSFPCKVKGEKSGNDVVYSTSVDGGATWSVVDTHSGVLSGKTTLYLKTIFAIAGSNKRIKVYQS